MHASGYKEQEALEDERFPLRDRREVSDAGDATMNLNLSCCDTCGAWVGDTTIHHRWHQGRGE
jgi:hypothetical protein